MHDGTSAAAAYAGAPHAAVIMMGTAMGIGFPPPIANLRPRAEPVILENFKGD
jgi:hypothetical protein